MLGEKTNAPNFALKNQNDELVSLSDFAGKPLVMYFYPEDDTPGCTTEAGTFRDDYADFKEKGIDIIGISHNSVESHQEFKEKYSLPFTLLSDPDHRIASLYGVWGKKQKEGREYEGIYRTTFLIDSEGIIGKVFEGVDPSIHSQEVLREVEKLI
ncbi:MAG TPA: thioredoxin-dependent thiol peroxidase [Bacteroidales bacterium]|nr:thioredoxin-dependent thiol peroxidase [Bacteroidales bacterium]